MSLSSGDATMTPKAGDSILTKTATITDDPTTKADATF
jgi:hypothetical protein